MKAQSVCFTGHQDIPLGELSDLKRALLWFVERTIGRRYDHFYCGGARGFDMLAGFTVLELKNRYPHVKLLLVIPHQDQDKRWHDEERAQYHELLNRADSVTCLSEVYYAGCMLKQNQYLVDHSAMCLAYITHAMNGTSQTVRLAKQQGLTVYNLAGLKPLYRDVLKPP